MGEERRHFSRGRMWVLGSHLQLSIDFLSEDPSQNYKVHLAPIRERRGHP
jgi:hypothetical protein